jgi:hypothetical protein
MTLDKIPQQFCWSKFGTESGEVVDHILARKERERQVNNGIFLWGIGNSVAPGIRALVRLEEAPMVIFSPMRSKPKMEDATPSDIVRWTDARSLDGVPWPIPSGSSVVSRADHGDRGLKTKHYALVCRSDLPLTSATSNRYLSFGALSNLLSGSPLGFSQVTSVVRHDPPNDTPSLSYPIGFFSRLVYPFFVELFSPVSARVSPSTSVRRRVRMIAQAKLFSE